MYPVWPSKESVDQFRDRLINYIQRPYSAERLFTNITKLNTTIPIYSAFIGNVPVFIKKECFGLGRGSFEREVLVSSHVNQLRNISPNFSTAFLQTTCPEGKILLSEYIPGPTLQSIIHNGPPFANLFSYFVQCQMALEVARNEIGFIHNDLLSSNIVGVKLPEKKMIRYGNYWVETDHFPLIFDYDRSYCYAVPDALSDPRRDIYTLLFSFFRFYPKKFRKLLSWYGVDFYENTLNRVSIEAEAPKLILHSIDELLAYGRANFKYRPIENGLSDILKPEPIPEIIRL